MDIQSIQTVMPACKVDVAVFLLWSLFISGQGVALRPGRSYHQLPNAAAYIRKKPR